MATIYAQPGAFMGRLAIMTCREHLCGYYEMFVDCKAADTRLDPVTGHRVCCSCGKPTADSGLRVCDTCDKEYINLDKYQDPRYETNCNKCIEKYGLDDD